MIKLNKIYTKTGDRGDTALGNGERVLKDSLRVSAYGNVDELNASIGVVTLYATPDLKGKLKNNLIEIADRKQAILKVLDMSRKGDIVIIAGKGHEKYQIYGNQKIPHDDFKFCQDIIENKGQK